MDRRQFFALTVPAALFIAACGGDDASPTGSPISATPTDAPATQPPGTEAPAGITHLTGANDVILRLGYSGGFVRAGTDFIGTPTVLITGDGHVIVPGVTTEQYPGVLVRPLIQRTITEEGIQIVLAAAQDAGLLQKPPKYASNDMIADAPNTVLVLQANDGSFTHSAYAIGIDTETDPARKALADFTEAVADLTTLVGEENLGPEEPFVPTNYRVMSMPTTLDAWEGMEPAPTTEAWPASTGIALADASKCAVVTAEAGDPVFSTATEITLFEDAGQLYQIWVAPQIPGDAPC